MRLIVTTIILVAVGRGAASAQPIESKPVMRPHSVQVQAPSFRPPLPNATRLLYCDELMTVRMLREVDGVGTVLISQVGGKNQTYAGLTSYSWGGKYQVHDFLVNVSRDENDHISFHLDRAVITLGSQIKEVPICQNG